MIVCSLDRQPLATGQAPQRIDVRIGRRRPRRFLVDYHAHGGAGHIALPPRKLTGAGDATLRDHSHFGLSLLPEGASSRFDFRFSPRGAWQAERSDRSGAKPIARLSDPVIDLSFHQPIEPFDFGALPQGRADVRDAIAEHLWLQVSLDLESLADLPLDVPLAVSLWAEIVEKSGARSLWTLPRGAGAGADDPRHCFALTLPAVKPR